MREFAKISPQIWIDEQGRKIKKLGLDAKLISLYLMTNPHANMIGVYYLPVSFIAHEVGLSVEQAEYAIYKLCEVDFCSYDIETEYIWVHEMGMTQISSQLKSKDHRVKGVNEAFNALPELPFNRRFFEKYSEMFLLGSNEPVQHPIEGASKPLHSKEKEKETESEKDTKNENENESKNILSGEPDIACEKLLFTNEKQTNDGRKEQAASYLSQAADILSFLNDKAKRNYRPEDPNINLIVGRLKSGATVDDCRAVIARKFRDWSGTEMQKYLRPATLFNAMKFEQYLGECVVVEEEQVNEIEGCIQDETE
jgi:uncharacterized phage protein (TIGR02220 family)